MEDQTIYVVIVHNKPNGRIEVVETHTCISAVKTAIQRLEKQYRTADLIQPYKVTLVSTTLQ